MAKATRRAIAGVLTLSLLGMFIVLGGGVVSAASDQDTHTVTFNVKAAIQLNVPEATYDFGDVDPINSPYSATGAVNPWVRCNTNWTLNVRGSGDFASGSNTVPLSRLGWRYGGGSYTAMTTSDAQVRTGTKTGGAGISTAVDYQLTVSWDDDVADGYSATITYTAVTP